MTIWPSQRLCRLVSLSPTMEMATIDPESAAFLRAREHYAIKKENESEVERLEREERDAIAREQYGGEQQADDWKRRRADQTHADFDQDGIWDSPGPGMPGGGLNEEIPGWFNPAMAQADYNPAVPRVPETEYRLKTCSGTLMSSGNCRAARDSMQSSCLFLSFPRLGRSRPWARMERYNKTDKLSSRVGAAGGSGPELKGSKRKKKQAKLGQVAG